MVEDNVLLTGKLEFALISFSQRENENNQEKKEKKKGQCFYLLLHNKLLLNLAAEAMNIYHLTGSELGIQDGLSWDCSSAVGWGLQLSEGSTGEESACKLSHTLVSRTSFLTVGWPDFRASRYEHLIACLSVLMTFHFFSFPKGTVLILKSLKTQWQWSTDCALGTIPNQCWLKILSSLSKKEKAENKVQSMVRRKRKNKKETKKVLSSSWDYSLFSGCTHGNAYSSYMSLFFTTFTF